MVPQAAGQGASETGKGLPDSAAALVGRHGAAPGALLIVMEGHRLAAMQDERFTHGRSAPEPVVTYKRGWELKHNPGPGWALGVAFLLANGEVIWSGC